MSGDPGLGGAREGTAGQGVVASAGGAGVAAGGTGAAVGGGSGSGGLGGAAGIADIGGGQGLGGSVGGSLGESMVGGAGGDGPALMVLSIDFIGGRWATADGGTSVLVANPAMAPSETAGVKAASHWNGASGPTGTLSNLLLSNGMVTTTAVSWSSPPAVIGPGVWNHNYADAMGDAKMMDGYLDPLSSEMPATVMVADLPASMTKAGYDVYVYTSGDIRSATTRTSRYAIGAVSFDASEVGPTPTSFPGFMAVRQGGPGNYQVFKNLVAASFKLTATPGLGAPTRAPVDGIQIVSPPGS